MHPLIDRLTTEMGWPHLDDMDAVRAFVDAPGAHCLFLPGDAKRNLETADVAVIAPELRAAFQHAFDAAVTGPGVQKALGEAAGSFKTPSLIFYRDGRLLGAIPKVRDWDDYVARIAHLLSLKTEAA
jgi:hydrogenase-1 operon protein HyaE